MSTGPGIVELRIRDAEALGFAPGTQASGSDPGAVQLGLTSDRVTGISPDALAAALEGDGGSVQRVPTDFLLDLRPLALLLKLIENFRQFDPVVVTQAFGK